MSESKIRVWLASLAFGCTVSLLLTTSLHKTHFGIWLPGSQPGWLLAWTTRIVRPGSVADDPSAIALVTVGNTAFYAWIFSRILRAEVAARGSLSRYFLR